MSVEPPSRHACLPSPWAQASDSFIDQLPALQALRVWPGRGGTEQADVAVTEDAQSVCTRPMQGCVPTCPNTGLQAKSEGATQQATAWEGLLGAPRLRVEMVGGWAREGWIQ